MKHWILLFAIFLLPVTVAAQSGTMGDLTWSITDGTLTISGNGAMPDYTNSVLNPWVNRAVTAVHIENGVTSIGAYAFYSCSRLTSVSIPGSVTSIGANAFAYCQSLTSVSIPGSVTSIPNSAFSSCNSLTSVSIPGSVTSIGANAFRYCRSLTSISIPSSVTSIGTEAFYSCESLTSVSIPGSMTSIGAYVFAYCEGLTSVSIPGSVTSIEPSAFQFCRSLTNISVDAESTYYASDDGVLFNYDKTTLIVCPEGKSGDYTIPGSVTSVRREAFRFCFSLINISVDAENRYYASDDGVLFNYDKTTLLVWPAGRKGDYIIPGSATGIGASAFINCRSLTSVSIPGSVTSIGENAFYDCDSLTSVSIPGSVTSIGAYAFGYSQGLTSVSISHGVTSIGKYAFAYCESLTSVSIPGSVTSMGAYAFWACQGLSSVSISNGVTSIGERMFSACRSLTSITIPGSVTSMGAGAFMGCSKLTDATVGWKTPLAVPADIFENTPIASCTLYVPRGTLERYRAAEVWKTFGTIKETAQDVTVEPVAPADAQPGYIILGLEMPADEAFSGTFYVLLPDGLSLDRANTALFEPLASLYELSVTQESAGLWLLRIAPETLRAAGTTYQEVVKIAYAADESTPAGEYDVVIRDLEFLFAGNTAIRQDEITVRITSRKGDGAGVETAGLQQTEVSVSNRILRVTSASAEQIYVYSASGALLCGAGKAPGTVTCNLGRFPQGVLIVRGSSGWTRKVMLR